MRKITINTSGNWRNWWGPAPLPQGATAHGTVTRDGYDHGALIEMATGLYVQGNACVIRSLPQRDVHLALIMAERGAVGGSATGKAKAAAARANGAKGGRPPKKRRKTGKPNAKADLAPASGAQVQRLVSQTEKHEG